VIGEGNQFARPARKEKRERKASTTPTHLIAERGGKLNPRGGEEKKRNPEGVLHCPRKQKEVRLCTERGGINPSPLGTTFLLAQKRKIVWKKKWSSLEGWPDFLWPWMSN